MKNYTHYKTLLDKIHLVFAELSKQNMSCRTNFTQSLMDGRDLIKHEFGDSKDANVIFYSREELDRLKKDPSKSPSINLGVRTNKSGEIIRVMKHFDLNPHQFQDGHEAIFVDMSVADINKIARQRMVIA